MISYVKIHSLLRLRMAKEELSLRSMSEASGIDYGTLWRLLKAKDNNEVFPDGKGRKGKVIMNLTADTLNSLCHYLKKQPADLISYIPEKRKK